MPKERYVSQGARFDETARAFWAHSGFNNQVGLLKLALSRAGVTGLAIPKPEPSLDCRLLLSSRAFRWAG